MKLGKAILNMQDKGYKVEMKKKRNDRGMALNKLLIGDDVPTTDSSSSDKEEKDK